MEDVIFKEVLESCNNVIELVANNSNGGETYINKTGALAEILKNYDELLHHHQLNCSALKATKDAEKEDSDFQGFDFSERYEKCLKEVKERAKKVKYSNLKQFEKQYCAPAKRKVSEGEVRAVAESSKECLIDPWTQKTIRELAKSHQCGHYFEHSIVLRMISLQKGTNRRKLKCPHVGCTAHLTEEDIEKVNV